MRRFFAGRSWGTHALTAVALVLGTLGFVHDGEPAARLELNDGGVWVTNASKRLVAHLNYPSRTLDGGFAARSADFDVTQHASTVLFHDTSTGNVVPVNTALVGLAGQGATLAAGEQVALQGGDVVAVVDEAAGKVWVLPATQIDAFSPEAEPVVEHADGLKAVVGTDGTLHVLAADGAVSRIAPGTARPEDLGRIDGIVDLAAAELTAVGNRLVVLDRAGPAVRTLAASVAVDSAADGETRLQEPGPAAAAVAVATPTTLLHVPLDGGEVTVVPGGPNAEAGPPAAPVRLGECVYGAWSGSGAYVRDCEDDADDEPLAARDALRGSTGLAFRVNRDVIVLNDVVDGTLFLVNDNMLAIDDWQTVQAQAEDQQDDDEESSETIDEEVVAEHTEENHPPIALPDEFGVRAGRSTTLPVLANDTDPDGDVLTAVVTQGPDGGTVASVRAGQALRVDVPADATGTLDLGYKASDGRGGESEPVDVRVEIRPAGSNAAPDLLPGRRPAVSVVQRESVTYSVLPDWIDPDGDDLYLKSASGPDSMTVRWRPDGVVTVRDLGTSGPGVRDVAVVVSDGAESTAGTIRVTVKARSLAPVANADHAVVVQGQEVVVRPLRNDVDPNGGGLRLTSVQEPSPGDSIRPDLPAGTFTFTAQTPGTRYVAYTIASGSTTATGRVRVDVLEREAAGPPSADNDIALLPATGSAMVDVLANDHDPAGRVLVVQSVTVPSDSGLSVQIVDHELLRVGAPGGLAGRTPVFSYTVSNGEASATGQVTVVELPPSASAAPVAVEDAATVRVRDVVSVPVLRNDVSPAGGPLTVISVEGGADTGDAFVSGDRVRFRAGDTPGTVRLVYTVQDSDANVASAEVVVTIRGADEDNRAPQPGPLEARVLAGETVTIPVPIDGVDPNGDSVTLTGVGSAPAKGRVTVDGVNLVYTAAEAGQGQDSFTYTVADPGGLEGTAEVRVGIAPRPATNEPPVAVTDDVAAQPHRALSVPVTRNDVDPDGDVVTLVQGSVAAVDEGTRVEATTDGNRVDLTTPGSETVLRYSYEVTDGVSTAGGFVVVTVTTEAPLVAPVARDDVVTAAEVAGKDVVEVAVLENDEDPDGDRDALQVTCDEPGASVQDGVLSVAVTDVRRVVLYTVTDSDGLTAAAAVFVPGAAESAQPPVLRDGAHETVKAGEVLEIRLADHVVVREGAKPPRLTFSDRVAPGPGHDGSDLVLGDETLRFAPVLDFQGETWVTFEVTDGATADDPDGQTATLSLPITVESAAPHPPVFRPAVVEVAAGESATVDLTPMVTDLDPGDTDRLRYTLGAVGEGLEASLDGSDLVVTARENTPPGTTGTAEIEVTDGSTPPVTGQVQVRVVASTRPPMQISPVEVTDARAGQPTTVDLARHVTNPFEDDGKPVELVGDLVASDGGAATAAGLVVTVTPPAGFHGRMTVTYVLQDATEDPSRRRQGVISLSVRDRPDAPTGVSAESRESRTATVAWTAGANNGSPIEEFEVRWAGGSQPCGTSTSCTVTGLTNDRTYTFTVAARNDVGWSDESASSNDVRPDVKPNPPGTPEAQFGDGAIALTWAAATTEGSAVTGYTVEISGAAAGSPQQEVAGTSLVWDGLANGTSYSFRVQAHSKADEPSEWSGWSTPEIPAGVPGNPAAPDVTMDPPSALAPSATVSWSAPDGNGDENMTYVVTSSTGWTSGPLTATSTKVTLEASTTGVTFQVQARNKAGDGVASPASTPVRARQTPGAVTGVSATATGANNTVSVSFSPAAGNGALPAEITYHWSANGQGGTIGAGGETLTSAAAFPNGQPVTVSVWATSTVDGVASPAGPSGTSGQVIAYGPPSAPQVSAQGNVNDVTLSWNASGSGNGRAIDAVRIETTDGGQQPVPIAGSTVQGNGRNQTKSIRAQARDAAGVWSPWSSWASASTWVSPSYSWSQGFSQSCTLFTSGTCVHVNLTLRAYNPNSNVYCFAGGVGAPDWYNTFRVDGNGNWGTADATGPPGHALVSGTNTGAIPTFGTCQQQ